MAPVTRRRRHRLAAAAARRCGGRRCATGWRRAGVAWAEDPSNADPRFERVRARAALPLLAPLGLGPERLAATAAAMARAREALERRRPSWRRGAGRGRAGRRPRARPGRARRRAGGDRGCGCSPGRSAGSSGARYRPRLARLEAALAAIEAGRVGHGLTLHGCVLRARGGRVAIRREPAAVAPPVPIARGVWDGRWRLEGVPPAGDDLDDRRARGGRASRQLGDWRATGLAREALLTTPAVWRGGSLVAAPVVGPRPASGFGGSPPSPPPWAPVMVR